MSEITLTKEADVLICKLYKVYLERRKEKMPRFEARFFSGSTEIYEKILPDWTIEDIDDACWELNRAGYLVCTPGDDSVDMAQISTDGIVYMENRFKNSIALVVSYLEKLLPFLPL